MHSALPPNDLLPTTGRPFRRVGNGLCTQRQLHAALMLLAIVSAQGCAAITFPSYGIPVYRLPEEMLSCPKDHEKSINLTWLKQPPPQDYLLAPGDVLGIWVAGVLGSDESGPTLVPAAGRNEVPGSGTPIRVRPDGTIHLPLIDEIKVTGLNIEQAEDLIREHYLASGVLREGLEQILVTLVRERTHNVLVFRQEQGIANAPRQTSRFTPQQENRFKRGTGHIVQLPAYRNDVLTALAESGGLPGLDAYNEIIIFHGAFRSPEESRLVLDQLEQQEPTEFLSSRVTRIPLRIVPGTPVAIAPEDIILDDGDVVYIEARDPDVFYTGGLLPTGEWQLPRDYDLDIIEAITLVRGPLASGGLQTTNFLLSQQLVTGELGGPSPSLAMVLRRTADGGQIPIRVDLNLAMTDASERILIHPGDVVLLQQTSEEAFARYLSGILRLDVGWTLFNRGDATGVATGRLPEQLPAAFIPFIP